MIKEPYKIIKYSDLEDTSLEKPKTISKTYIEFCEPKPEDQQIIKQENEFFIENNKPYLIPYKMNKQGKTEPCRVCRRLFYLS
ncbi:hypothetical protein [Acinetobacter guillouiae]|uniref:hypothetical protein n=1 Tax=Acinetobacter guillouiae TaxID=106649 RepID=UPI003AF6AD11